MPKLTPHQQLCQALDLCGISYTVEYRAIPARGWRFDVAIPAERPWLLVEVHGGVWTGGRHTRGAGFTRDREKVNAATLAGFTVLEYTSGQVESGEARHGIEQALAAHQQTS